MNAYWQQFIDSVVLDNLPRPLLDNALYPQTRHGFIEVSGPDALKFLQGQLSCDVQQITMSLSGLGSHSNAKGRMQSSFRICRTAENTFLLRVHASIIEHARATLAKYIVFSKAAISANTDIAGIGLHGAKAAEILRSVFTILPTEDFQQYSENGSFIICTSAAMQSYEIYTRIEKAVELWHILSAKLPVTGPDQHTLVENRLGLAFVESGTLDAFIPQMFNYQCTPAISFKKGCYTGQEIVARMHYLGKVKRHMRHYTVVTEASLAPGMPLLNRSGQNIGDILSAVAIGNGHWDLLANLTDEAASEGMLGTASTNLQHMVEVPLPYPLSN